GPGARRQAPHVDETLRHRLPESVALRVRREGVIVEGVGRGAADDGGGSLEQLDADVPGHPLLSRGDEGVERLPEGGEPEAVVHERGVAGGDGALELEQVPREDQGLEGLVGLDEDGRGGAFVHLAGLDPDDARLDVVDAADAVAARELIEGSDQVDELEPPTLEGRRLAAFEMDRRVRGLVRRGGGTRRPAVDFLRWLDPRILEDSAFDGAAPEVLVR